MDSSEMTMKTTDKKIGLISALGAGAGLMYIFDPLIGRRRRAFVRDKVVRLTHKTADAIDASMRDLKNRASGTVAVANRASGTVAVARGLFPTTEVDDNVLAGRVRSNSGF
jgi:hypothetical protein